MKGKWIGRIWLPAICAILILLIIGIIDLLGFVPVEQKDKLEFLSNSALFAVAVLGIGLRGSRNLNDMISNMAVPAVAFSMNIGVFHHNIRVEHLWTDIWGIHFGWLLCLIVQLLLLTGLGRLLLSWIGNLLKWGLGISREIGTVITKMAVVIKQADGSVLLVMIGGTVLWCVYLCIQIRARGMAVVLSEAGFAWKSAIFWIAWIVVCFLLYIFLPVCRKSVDGIREMGGKNVLAIVALAAFLILMGRISSLVNTAVFLAVVLLTWCVGCFAMWRIMKKMYKVTIAKINRKAGAGSQKEEIKVNSKDVMVVIISFVFVPLGVIILMTAALPGGKEMIAGQGLSDAAAWMDFLGATVETAGKLLEIIFW